MANETKRPDWRSYEAYVRRTAERVFHQYAARVEREELRQAGLLALVEACSRFDPDRAATFGAYVRLRVKGAIRDAARRETARRVRYAPAVGGEASSASDGSRRAVMRVVPLTGVERGSATFQGQPQVAKAWSGNRRSIESEVMVRDLVRSLRRRLSSLRLRERQAVEAYDLEGLSFAAAGRQMGMSAAGVLHARRRALRQLRASYA